MSLLGRLGKKHMELAGIWLGSGIAFGGSATVGLLYITDWKAVVEYLPYYNGKFKTE